MNVKITPGKLTGTIAAIPSKSQAHRLLICAALGQKEARLECAAISQDIAATMDCLNALGAKIQRTDYGFQIEPMQKKPEKAFLNCRESGSTLRFLLPIVGALGVQATFQMAGRLPKRPLSPLWEEMERMGCKLSWQTENTLLCQGQLQPGAYEMAGNVSSQFVSGLLLALPLLQASSTLRLTGQVESRPYIALTLDALRQFGVEIPEKENIFYIPEKKMFRAANTLSVEGDWSNGAFWLAAKALGSSVQCTGLNSNSAQGDRAIGDLLPRLGNGCAVDLSDIPDLAPILAVAATAKPGCTRFIRAARLRLKESDRIASVCALVSGLGGRAEEQEDGFTIWGGSLAGGTITAAGDHRIAMAAAIAATVCQQPVTILGAEAVEKSYPAFWQDYARLGGKIEVL